MFLKDAFRVVDQKDIDKSWNEKQEFDEDTIGVCSYCGATVSLKYNEDYCGKCGEKIVWEDGDE